MPWLWVNQGQGSGIMRYRNPRGKEEFRQLYDLAVKSPINSGNIFDLPYRFASWSAADLSNTFICEDEAGRILAWATIQLPFWALDFAVAEHGSLASLDTILDWADTRMAGHYALDRDRDCWFVTVLENQAEAIGLLEGHGFACQSQEGENAWEKRLLEKRITPHKEKRRDGHAIRSLRVPGELELYVALHQEVFGTKNMTIPWRSQAVEGIHYDNSYDLVCEDHDGSLVGFCIAWANRAEKIAHIEPLGVSKKYEGRGIGTALLRELEIRLAEDGIEKLLVETDVSRERALGIYERNGFLETGKILVFRKNLG